MALPGRESVTEPGLRLVTVTGPTRQPESPGARTVTALAREPGQSTED